MIFPNLPFADLNDIKSNFQNVGQQTGFTLQQFIAQCISVTVLFLVLNQFAWKPVRTILEQRRKTIEESLANAEKIKKELADAEATRLSIIQKANDQANHIISDLTKQEVRISRNTIIWIIDGFCHAHKHRLQDHVRRGHVDSRESDEQIFLTGTS